MWIQTGRTAERKNPLRGEKAESKRQKQVYKTDEIPHLWAHRSQESARNSQGNLYFSDGVIYSYGNHFPMARHVTAPLSGYGPNSSRYHVIFITTRKYSTTTAHHLSQVRRAIPGNVTTFHVVNVLESPAEQVRRLERSAKETAQNLNQGVARRQKSTKVKLYESIVADVEQARKIQECFGHKERAEMPKVPDGMDVLVAEVQAAAEIRRQRANEARAAKRAKWQEEYDKRQETERLKLPEKIEAWRNGASVNFGYESAVPTMLRINGDDVETSMGARFPLSHAIRALRLYQMIRKRGEQWKRNGHNIHLGNYQIDVIETDGTVRAGCHVVTADEVRRFAEVVKEQNGCTGRIDGGAE